MINRLVVALHLILVHAPNGEDIHINIDEISSIRDPENDGTGQLMHRETNCIIGMTNGKFISTREPCKEIIKKLAIYNKYPEEAR